MAVVAGLGKEKHRSIGPVGGCIDELRGHPSLELDSMLAIHQQVRADDFSRAPRAPENPSKGPNFVSHLHEII